MFRPSYNCLRSDGGVTVCVVAAVGHSAWLRRGGRESRGSLGSAPRSQDGGDCSDRREARSSAQIRERRKRRARAVARPRSTHTTHDHTRSHDTRHDQVGYLGLAPLIERAIETHLENERRSGRAEVDRYRTVIEPL